MISTALSQIEQNLILNYVNSILHVFLNNTHHTGNTYIITINFSMEALVLINGINSIFRNLYYLIEDKCD